MKKSLKVAAGVDATGIILDGATYTTKALAGILGRNEKWIIDNVVDQGCPAKRRGNLFLISGRDFRIWVEATTEVATKKERNRRKADQRLDRQVPRV